MCACGKHMSYMKVDHRSYRRKFCSCEKKAWKKNQACTVLEPLTSTIPVQRSYHIITLKNPRDRTGMRALTLQAFPDNARLVIWWWIYTRRPTILFDCGRTSPKRTDLRLCIIALHEEMTDHNSLTAISFASKLDEFTYKRDLFPIRRKDNDINASRSQAIQLQPQSKLLGHLTVFLLS